MVTVAFNDGVPLYVDLPAAVELTVSPTDPGLQGDRSTGGTKPAKLETGARDPGAAVHRHRREGQGRHADRPVPRPRLRVSARSKARKRALDMLFEAELRGEPVIALMEERHLRPEAARRCRSTPRNWSAA